MTWLRMDDKAHMDPRVVTAGNAAWGLFVRCADWSADHLTDGFVPLPIARHYATDGARGRAELAAITRARLWDDVQVPEPGFLIVDFLDQGGLVSSRSRDAVLAERRKATERQRRHRDGNVTDVSRRDMSVSHGPPDQTRPDPTSAVTEQTTTTRDHPSVSSSSTHGIPPSILDACLLLIAEAITVAHNRPRAYRHGVHANLRAERADEVAARLAAGATALDIAADEAGGRVWAEQAVENLRRGRPMELVQ